MKLRLVKRALWPIRNERNHHLTGYHSREISAQEWIHTRLVHRPWKQAPLILGNSVGLGVALGFFGGGEIHLYWLYPDVG